MDLLTQLKRDEGEVLHAYLDSRGILTCGVGHNLIARPVAGVSKVGDPISQSLCDYILRTDISTAQKNLATYLPWTAKLDPIRLAALLNLTFNIGVFGLLKFHNALAALQAGDYMLAATNFLDSEWSRQVGDRAIRVTNQIRNGQWN